MASSSRVLPIVPGKALTALSAWRGLHRYTLLATLLITFVGLVTFVAPTDPDVWWHLRNGRLILEAGIPSQDVYSFTAQGRPWLVQEWLTEVLMYGMQRSFGYGTLSLLFGMLQALGGALVYLLLRRQGAGRITALLLLMLYLVFAAPTWGVRPQVLTPVFLGVFYLILLKYKADSSQTRSLWLLPVLTALWCNMHASYFIGIALVGAFLVGEFANNYLYKSVPTEAIQSGPTPLRPLLYALVGCLAATLLNPYFISLWTYPLTYVLHGTSNPLLRYTQEWQSPDFHQPGNLLFGLSLVLLALLGIASPKSKIRIDATYAILLAAFALLALQAVRLVPLYGVIALPMLAGAITSTWPALSRENEAPPTPLEGKANVFVGVVSVALVAYLVLGTTQAQTQLEPRTITSYTYPAGAASYIGKMAEPVRMYNNFAWGGYLIYRLYPQHLVFIDGRADMYREGIFDDFMVVQNVAPGWREVLTRYGVNVIVIIPGSSLDYALLHEPGWKVGYKDQVAVVYRRSE